MNRPYRETFAAPSAASQYDSDQYASGSYWDVLWRLEQEVLRESVRNLPRPIRYLDYACGTGRVLSFVAPLVDEAVGVDVSSAMLERASQRGVPARLLQADLAENESAVDGPFDLITSFRFVLNVEPSVRRAVLPVLSRLLRSDQSLLILNCHGSLESYKALTLPLRWAREKFLGRSREHVLSDASLREELRSAGLEVVSVRGMGVLPGGGLRWLPSSLRYSTEAALSGSALWRLGVNKIYICRRAA